MSINLTIHPFLVDSYGAFTWLQYTFCYVSDWYVLDRT